MNPYIGYFFLETCNLVDQASQKVFPLKFLDQFEERVPVYLKIRNFYCFRTIETLETMGIYNSDTSLLKLLIW